jgi:hypothetical protein
MNNHLINGVINEYELGKFWQIFFVVNLFYLCFEPEIKDNVFQCSRFYHQLNENIQALAFSLPILFLFADGL